MWEYIFEVPILMILAIILAFYFSRPRLPIRRNLVFVHLILIETLTIIFDVSASVADNDYASYSIMLLKVLNMFYFIAFFERAYIMYLFTVSVLKDSMRRNMMIRHLIRLPLYLGIFLSILSAAIGSAIHPYLLFYIDGSGYHPGELYNILYICGFFYVLLSFVSWALYRKNLGRKLHKYGIVFYNMIILASMAVRLSMPSYLVMDTFILIAILVVFLAFGNPEFYLDLRGTAFNRVALMEHIEENREQLRLVPFGVVIHNYFEMRDIYGTAQIEEGFALIARYLKRIFHKGIVFYCRNGRFVVLVRQGTDIAEKIRGITERFNDPWKSENTELYLSVDFATFELVKEMHTSEVLLRTMLRSLDKAGRRESEDLLVVTEEDIRRIEREKWVRQCIESAIDGTGFELYLQPIVDAATGRPVGAEALSRIKDPEGNIISPEIFIPVAESSGRINRLGELVFERTCEFIKEKGLKSLGMQWINVNLSPAQFLCTDLAERYSEIVERYGVDPQTVHLEITEGALVDECFLQRQIKAFGEKGFIFVLDDYGTGYSNLARLKRCPFANIKLDMSIVWDYCREPDEILPNMIRAFKNMGFAITAEGIEDENMVSTMKNIGCDFIQGYYYSKPVPADAFAEMLHGVNC